MRPFAESDGHDLPRLVDELVPCGAAMGDDVVVVLEDTVGEPVVAHELCQTFSTGLSSGERGGRNIKVMLSGTFSFGVTCHPA